MLRSFAFGSMRTLTARSLTKVLPSSSCFSVPRALLANIFFNSTSFGRRSSSRNCDDFALQSKIRRNSARKEGFMPAYINGFIVLEKNIKKGQSSWMLRGTTTSEAKRCITTMIQNGIQHSAKANTTMASDLVSLICLTVNQFSLPSAWAVEAMFRL